MRLILASASPRRAELLRAAGFAFEIVTTDVDERVRDGEAPAEYVRRLAREKAAHVVSAFRRTFVGPAKAGHYSDDAIVIGADTAVVVDGAILGKPIDDADAAEMLRRLSGRTHEVLTGVSVRRGERELSCVETTRVEFAPLSHGDIAWYVSSGEGRDKAGAYAIQGLAARFISRIDGSYSNVVGLPIAALAELLGAIERRP
jgi:septum formation protein